MSLNNIAGFVSDILDMFVDSVYCILSHKDPVFQMQFLKPDTRMPVVWERVNIVQYIYSFWCFITNNWLLHNKQHRWRVKGNTQTDIDGKGTQRRAKNIFTHR